MANQTLEQLGQAVTRMTDTAAGAVAVLNGISARIQTAVDAAIAGGATADEIAPVQAEVDALNASAQALGDAVAANTTT